MRKKYILSVILLTVFFTSVHSQQIMGTIQTENNVPIENVSVSINEETIATTDENGAFILPEKFEIPISVLFQHPDYVSKTMTVLQTEAVYFLSKTETLKEVFISSSYQKESRVIIPTSKVNAEAIENYSPLELSHSLNRIPGVYVQAGALNTSRIIIRGVGSRTLYGTNKIRAYFNGIPITNGVGETPIDAFDPEDLENIEIVKGPKATHYGTNLGGTMLLNSKEPIPGTATVKNNMTVGSFGLFKNSVAAGFAEKGFSVHFNYDYLKTDGFRDNSDYLRKSYLLTSKYSFSENSEMNILFNQTDYFAEIPSSLGITDFRENPEKAAFTWAQAQGFEDNKHTMAGLGFTHRFSESFSNSSSVFYNYLDHYEPRPFNILDEHSQGFGGRTLFTKSFSAFKNTAELSFGSEFYKDEYYWKTIENLYEDNHGNGSLEGNELSDNEEYREQWNVFASVILPFSQKLKAQLGLNFNTTNYDFQDEFNSGESNKSAKRQFDPIFAPNLNVTYQWFPQAKIYGSISRGFNYPNVEETLTPAGVINPDIGPEKGWNYELGSAVFLFDEKLHLNFAGYVLKIEDLLVAQRVGENQYIGRNAGKTSHKGIEISLNHILNLTEKIQLHSFANASFNDHSFVEFDEGDNDFSGNALTGVPDKTIAAGINLKHQNGLFLYSNLQHVGEIPMNDANTLHSEKYTVANLKAGYSAKVSPHLILEGNFGINNIADEKYASAILINATGFGNTEPRFYYPGMPRNYYGSVKVDVRF